MRHWRRKKEGKKKFSSKLEKKGLLAPKTGTLAIMPGGTRLGAAFHENF